MKSLIFLIMLLAANVSLATDQILTKEQGIQLCKIKLAIFEQALDNRKKIRLDDMLRGWQTNYPKFKKNLPTLIVYDTEVDVERGIREVYRKTKELDDAEYAKGFLVFEAAWCGFYHH